MTPERLPAWLHAPWRVAMRAHTEDRMPHALLLAGQAGLGKLLFARELARALNCQCPGPSGVGCGQCRDCRMIEGDAHPDVVCVEPEEPGKALTIGTIRGLISKAVLTPEAGRRRVFVLAPAEALNAAAANALLKTLEEPTPGSLFLLVSAHPAGLLATIRSRCQLLRFPQPNDVELEAWLASETEREQLRVLLPLLGRAPLRAQNAVALEEAIGLESFGQAMLALRSGEQTPAQVATTWSGADTEWILILVWHWLADLIRLKHCAEPPLLSMPGLRNNLLPLARELDLSGMHRILLQVERQHRERDHNLNPQLMMERLFIDWQRLGRIT